MATKNKRLSYGYRPTQYQKHGYFAPIEDRLYRQTNMDDNEEMFETEPVQPFLRIAAEEQMKGYRPNGQGARIEAPQPSRKREAIPGYRTTAYFDDFDPNGMSRDELRKVQRALNENGARLAEDGIWGPRSKRAMEEYRSALKPRPEEDAEPVQEPVADNPEVIPVPTEEANGAEESRKKADREKMFVDAYGSIVPTFFARMMDMSKPTQYVTADDRMRAAGKLARSVAPFADSGFAKNIYADARNREIMMNERANKGEENVLQRRTTAENMWGHYSPAITQAMTNASVFMQRAYQADEEAAKLESLAEAKKIEAQENENILRSRFDQVKTNFYMNGKPISFDEFKQLVSTGQTGLLRSRGKISNEKISALAKEFQTVVSLNNEKTQLEEAAKKQRNMAVQAHQIADVNSRFAEESHAHFGFPTIKLSGLLQNKGRVDYPTPKGTRETLDEQTEDTVAGAQNRQPPVASQNVSTGYAPGSQTLASRKSVPSDRVKAIQTLLNKNGYPVDVDGIWGPKTEAAFKAFDSKSADSSNKTQTEKTYGPEDIEAKLEDARKEYIRYDRNQHADVSKWDAATEADRGNEAVNKYYTDAQSVATTKKQQDRLSTFVFNEYMNREKALNPGFARNIDPRLVAFNTQSIQNLWDRYSPSEAEKTYFSNLVSELTSGRLGPEEVQERVKKLENSLISKKLLPTGYKVQLDGSNLAIIPKGYAIWTFEDGTKKLVKTPKEVL